MCVTQGKIYIKHVIYTPIYLHLCFIVVTIFHVDHTYCIYLLWVTSNAKEIRIFLQRIRSSFDDGWWMMISLHQSNMYIHTYIRLRVGNASVTPLPQIPLIPSHPYLQRPFTPSIDTLKRHLSPLFYLSLFKFYFLNRLRTIKTRGQLPPEKMNRFAKLFPSNSHVFFYKESVLHIVAKSYIF